MSSPLSRPPLAIPLIYLGLGLAACLFGVVAAPGAREASDPTTLLPWVAGVPLVGLGLYAIRRRRWPPQVWTLGERRVGAGAGWDLFVWLVGTPALVGFGALGTYFMPDDSSSTDFVVANLAIGAAMVMPALFAILLFRADHACVMNALRAARGPALRGPEGQGRIVGKITAGSIERRREYSITETSREELVTRSDGTVERRTTGGSAWSWVEITSAPSLIEVETPDGPLSVQTRGALFGSAEGGLESASGAVGGHAGPRSSSTTRKARALIERARPGDAVVLFVRAKPEQPAEAESIFTASSNRSPLGRLRLHVMAHFVVLPMLIALTVWGLWIQASLVA